MPGFRVFRNGFVSPGSVCFEIAGLGIEITSSLPLAGRILPPEYDAFRVASERLKQPVMRVTLEAVVPSAVLSGGIRSGQWTFCKEGRRRRIVWHANHPESPHWAASFEPGNPAVQVECGPALWRDDAEGRKLANPFRYPLDQLVLMYALAERGQGIVHAAGLTAGGACIVAAGRSGAGKSTISRLWRERHGNASLLSDDRVIVGRARSGGGSDVCGTPWPGELGVASAGHHPLRSIVFLRKAKENRLVPIGVRETVERLLPLTTLPWFDDECLGAALANVEYWVAHCACYDFHFAPDMGAVDALEGLCVGGGNSAGG